MNWIDIIIIICLGISIFYSLSKGMTREIFSLAAIFAGYIIADNYYHLISSLLHRFISNQKVTAFMGFFIVFIVVSIVTSVIGRLIRRILKMSHALSLMDRFGGGVIGLLKGVLIVSLILIPVNMLPSARREILYNSKIAQYLLSSSKFLSQLSYDNFKLPNKEDTQRLFKDIHGRLTKQINGLRNNIKGINAPAPPKPEAHIPEKDKKKLNKIISEVLPE